MRILQGWGCRKKHGWLPGCKRKGLLGREKLDGSFRRIGTADAVTSAVTAPFSGR